MRFRGLSVDYATLSGRFRDLCTSELARRTAIISFSFRPVAGPHTIDPDVKGLCVVISLAVQWIFYIFVCQTELSRLIKIVVIPTKSMRRWIQSELSLENVNSPFTELIPLLNALRSTIAADRTFSAVDEDWVQNMLYPLIATNVLRRATLIESHVMRHVEWSCRYISLLYVAFCTKPKQFTLKFSPVKIVPCHRVYC